MDCLNARYVVLRLFIIYKVMMQQYSDMAANHMTKGTRRREELNLSFFTSLPSSLPE